MAGKTLSVDKAREQLAAAQVDAEAKRQAHADANSLAWAAYNEHQASLAVITEKQAQLEAAYAANAEDPAAKAHG